MVDCCSSWRITNVAVVVVIVVVVVGRGPKLERCIGVGVAMVRVAGKIKKIGR